MSSRKTISMKLGVCSRSYPYERQTGVATGVYVMISKSASMALLVFAATLLPVASSFADEYGKRATEVEGTSPVRTGSAGNSNTGPGFDPAYGQVQVPGGPPARSRVIESNAPVRTGSAGNSNTGPGFDPAYGRETVRTGAPSRTITVETDAPVETGSAGNSNTGPGFDPAYGVKKERLR
jgi:hypothetical protein